MRLLGLTVVLFGGLAAAQHEGGGVWTGYVGGWRPNHVVPQPLSAGRAPTLDERRLAQWQWWQMANLQTHWAMQTEFQRRAAAEQAQAERQAEAAQAFELEQARRAQADAERRLALEREAALQRQLDDARRLAAERELVTLQRLEAERATAAAALAKANAEKAAPAPAVLAAREDAKPATPGNEIYRWVDDEGVVHYSTRVPDAVKASAKRVSGSR
ncbi:MAG: DUF4124 domain-containing protein [Myxococcaceae bacterium]|nr:DUF4124 domain-containing protein [Myxococcaceae bacterium]MCA3012667.1 DUF4124 domain-containing protein [Myxococcaceae bacterium]